MPARDDLALVADELPVAIWLGTVPGGETTYTNHAFREVLGMDPPADATRGTWVEPYGVHTLTGEKYPADQMPFERVLAARGPVVLDDLVIHRHDGRKVNIRVFAKPVFDAEGTITHVLEAFIDITREIESERARVEGERRLARSQRLDSIGQLVAGIAHDFNNLLTVTKLAVSWLQRDEPDPARQETLGQISVVTDSAIDLIKNLLNFARRGRKASTPVLVEPAIQRVLEMANRTFDRAITLRSDLDAGDATVVGDSSQLEHLLLNLVLNARDSISGAGEVLVRTRTRLIAAFEGGPLPGRYVVIEIIDTGAGVDPAIRDRIFEPYFTTKTQGPIKGTGLGLSIVHGIVQAHGGVIDVVGNRPRGTIIRVTLPAAEEGARVLEVAVQRSKSGRAVPDPLPRQDGRVVLVVDDEPLVRASTAASLRSLGFRVREAGDGRAAIAVFREHHAEIDAVVLDMVMPGLRGRDVYLAFRELRPDVRVLLVTGNAFGAEVQSILDLGVGAYLPKPYDDRQLMASLRHIGAF